jgi:hypothetical protein
MELLKTCENPRIKRNTKKIGDISETMVLAAFVRAGYKVSIPFGEDNRYDFIIDRDGILSRVQVKTGRLRKGVVLFNCYSSHTHRKGIACRPYTGEIEYFAVYCPDTNETYLLRSDAFKVARGSLRVCPAKNGQQKGLHWAADHVLSSTVPAENGAADED